ncbi:hypothetical protein SNEBB_004179 [Seison nebaliae]|nr:hypothetical protein SNEBB_004179 [Seison nebaliae]
MEFFDIYFTSSISYSIGEEHTTKPINYHDRISKSAPANRLVLFVADGLRVDRLYDNQTVAPYLHNIIRNVGVFGVSHTRVPTESRPGHVAMLAGFYEDVAAVTKGWQKNPVDFDSVFNQSRHSYCWGSPDILDIFKNDHHKKNNQHIVMNTYPSTMEDLSSKSPQIVDDWVFDEVEGFLKKYLPTPSKWFKDEMEEDWNEIENCNNLTRLQQFFLNENSFGIFYQNQSDKLIHRRLIFDRGIIFFLHLLGVDTAGHSSHPYSSVYLNTIHNVDKGVKMISKEFKSRYQMYQEFFSMAQTFRKKFNENCHFYLESDDNRIDLTLFDKTSFLFTSDHGMTNWGSHGAGLPEETNTPIILWGRGNRGIKYNSNKLSIIRDRRLRRRKKISGIMSGRRFSFSNDDRSIRREYREDNWNFSHLVRHDIEQADITPLISAILGITIPKNNIGKLPIDYLAISENGIDDHYRLMAFLTNTKQLFSQIKAKYFERKNNRRFLPIISHSYSLNKIKNRLMKIENEIHEIGDETTLNHSRKFSKISNELNELCDELVDGNEYFHSYDRIWWQSIIILSYVFWIAYHILWLIDKNFINHQINTFIRLSIQEKILIFSILFLTSIMFCGRDASIMHHIYLLLFQSLFLLLIQIRKNIKKFKKKNIFQIILMFLISEYFVTIFFYRQTLVIFLIILILIYLKFNNIRRMDWSSKTKRIEEIFGLTILIISPFLPTMAERKQLDMKFIIIGCLFIIYEMTKLFLLKFKFKFLPFILHTISIILSLIIFRWELFDGNDIIVNILRGLNWSFLILIPIYIIQMKSSIDQSIYFSSLVYLSLSTNYDNLFIFALIYMGRLLKKQISIPNKYLSHIYLYLLLLSFFGTGNLASINSFDPYSVHLYLSIFSPFVMGFLLLAKMISPLIVVTMYFELLTIKYKSLTKMEWEEFFVNIIIIFDIMAMNFFLLIKTEGSWLDIGVSISHYVIVLMTILVVIILQRLSHVNPIVKIQRILLVGQEVQERNLSQMNVRELIQLNFNQFEKIELSLGRFIPKQIIVSDVGMLMMNNMSCRLIVTLFQEVKLYQIKVRTFTIVVMSRKKKGEIKKVRCAHVGWTKNIQNYKLSCKKHQLTVSRSCDEKSNSQIFIYENKNINLNSIQHDRKQFMEIENGNSGPVCALTQLYKSEHTTTSEVNDKTQNIIFNVYSSEHLDYAIKLLEDIMFFPPFSYKNNGKDNDNDDDDDDDEEKDKNKKKKKKRKEKKGNSKNNCDYCTHYKVIAIVCPIIFSIIMAFILLWINLAETSNRLQVRGRPKEELPVEEKTERKQDPFVIRTPIKPPGNPWKDIQDLGRISDLSES